MFFNLLFGFAIADLKCMEYLSKSRAQNDDLVEFETPLPLIVAGEYAIEGEFPHMAQIGFMKNGSETLYWTCGGSLISELYVVTAAHCTGSTEFGTPKMVRLGSINVESKKNVQLRAVVATLEHPSRKGYYNDIALMRLDRPVAFNHYIKPACLNTCGRCQVGKAIATGFGSIDYSSPAMSNHLMKTNLEIYPNKNCSRIHAHAIKEVLQQGVVKSQICAGSVDGKDTCHGDSGGPLQIKIPNSLNMYRLLGVTSFGLFCGQPNTPSFYTRISYYVEWIEKIVWKE